MESRVAILTDKEQAVLRTVGITGMPTARTSLTGIMGINSDRHTSLQQSFVGNHALQFGKTPFGVGGVGFPLLLRRLLALTAVCSLSDICQIFQTDKTVGVCVDDALGDHMIGVLLQPSLSPTNRHKATGSGASAFFLKTLSQSRVMIGFGYDALAAVEKTIPLRIAGHRQIAHAHIDPNHAG